MNILREQPNVLDVISGTGHCSRCHLHGHDERRRQFACAETDSGIRVRNLVEAHLGDDCPGPSVLNRQFAEVMIKVRFDLSLGFGQKAQAPGVAQSASSHADGQRAKVPERVQQACAAAQISKAALGPGQMFGFLVGSFLQCLPKVGS
jgi:hypothetical protein